MWKLNEWISFLPYRGKLFDCLYSSSLLGNGWNNPSSYGFDPSRLGWVGYMFMLCVFLVIWWGWTHLDALSLIVHHCKQFGKEINRNCNYFYGIHVVWSFSTVYSAVIICQCVLCSPLIISLLLVECYQVYRQNSLH